MNIALVFSLILAIAIIFWILLKLTQTLLSVVRNTQQKFREDIVFHMIKAMISIIDKNQFRHQGYSLGDFIDLGNFSHILHSIETHSNITRGSEEHSVEVSARDCPSYE